MIYNSCRDKKRTASRAQRREILLNQKNCCFICKKLNFNLEVDHHIVPFSVGGPTELWNLKALCPNCHAEKSRGSNEPQKIRTSKYLKKNHYELCWICEKTVSPYFFSEGVCSSCNLNGSHKNTVVNNSPLPSKFLQSIWLIPTSPIV
jgi:5-methylcytosine-specific restriction endonuclease McrA